MTAFDALFSDTHHILGGFGYTRRKKSNSSVSKRLNAPPPKRHKANTQKGAGNTCAFSLPET